jgi:hypothetical protein
VYDMPTQPHHDLIHAIWAKLASSPIRWKFRHVRGHQDKHVPIHLLDLWSQFNVEMDSLAKTYWNETQMTVKPLYPSNSLGWSLLWIRPRKLSDWDWVNLYNHAQATNVLTHWSQRQGIPMIIITSIYWEACEDAITCPRLNHALWVPEWLAGYAPVGKVMKRYKFQPHAECPRCSAFEDTLHGIRCTAPWAIPQWDESMAHLDAWLAKASTMPDIWQAIMSRLKAWKTHDEPSNP